MDNTDAGTGEQDGGEDNADWEGFDQDGDALEVDPDRSSGKHKKPPTGEELREIKDASDLYRSSAFKFQVRAML